MDMFIPKVGKWVIIGEPMDRVLLTLDADSQLQRATDGRSFGGLWPEDLTCLLEKVVIDFN